MKVIVWDDKEKWGVGGEVVLGGGRIFGNDGI